VELDGFSRLLAKAMLVLVPMLLSLTVHEFAHALAAKKLGDDTAERQGRLTLNPLAHADPIGTFALPLLIILASAAAPGIPFLGWAKPVPVDPRRFSRVHNMRTGMMLTAAAGPLSNLVLAFVCGGLLAGAQHTGVIDRVPVAVVILLSYLVRVNIGLFVFNMVPVYPLDGQKVLAGFLSGTAALNFEKFNYRFGWMTLMVVIFFAGDLLAKPVNLMELGLKTVLGLG